jgi:hypothetical protein
MNYGGMNSDTKQLCLQCQMENQMTFQRLIEKWNQWSRRAFYDAEREQDPMGKRLIEHGAMCYFNCATDLTEALASLSPQPSAIAKEDQR